MLVDYFFGNKTLNQCFGTNLKNPFICKILLQICSFFSFFHFFSKKMLKMTILTSIWGVQHSKPGQNIQHPRDGLFKMNLGLFNDSRSSIHVIFYIFYSMQDILSLPGWRHECIWNKAGLQPVSRPVELVHYFRGWVEGPSKQTDRTDGGWVQSTFGAKAEQIKLAALRL